MKKAKANDRGSALLAILILTTVASVMLASALGIASSNVLTTKHQKERLTGYLEAEESLNKTLNWLRDNSSEFVAFASMDSIYSEFDFGSPIAGSNEGSTLEVPGRVFINGTTEVPILTNDNSLATASFPTGSSKNLVSDFNSADLGNSIVRLTLINMLPSIPSKDYGDTDLGNPTPETHFYPVIRIDAMDDTDEGAHVHGFVIGSLVESSGVGFYGEDYVTMNQGCDSYDSGNGAYGGSNKNANCGVGSAGPISLHQNEEVYGSIKTTNTVVTTSPYGGDVCADFVSGCPNAGETCEGVSCQVPSLPIYDSWATYCPTDQGNKTYNSNSTLSLASDNAADKCWNQMKVRPNKTLTLTTTDYGYFFKTFDIANNAVIDFQPSPSTGVINLYVEKFVGDKFNGGQVFNLNNSPTQLKIHYLGTDELVLNGNADMNAFIVAPYATVKVQGNFDFYGGIMAKALEFTGSGELHYDEAGEVQVLSDVTFRLRDFVQRYKL